jgi:hypothetical protein
MRSRKAVAFATFESVKLPIYHRPVKVGVKPSTAVPGANGHAILSEPTVKTYDSYQIAYYEAGRWRSVRASTLEKAKIKGRLIARRLAENGSEVADLSQAERRIYVLAKKILQPCNLEVDGAARLVCACGPVVETRGRGAAQKLRDSRWGFSIAGPAASRVSAGLSTQRCGIAATRPKPETIAMR